MSEDVLERVRVFVMSQEPWRAIEALRLIDALAAEVRALRAKVTEFERLARMVVDGQLTENERDRAVYRRGFRALLESGGEDGA